MLGLCELPEVADEAEALEDRHVLLARVRLPAGREAVVPPRERELGELRDGDRGARLARAEPAGDVLFRPEEVHRRSGEDDVVPPVPRRDEDLEEERLVARVTVPDLEGKRLAAVGARR